MKVEVAVLGFPSLIILLVCAVDLKQRLKKKKTLKQSSGAVGKSSSSMDTMTELHANPSMNTLTELHANPSMNTLTELHANPSMNTLTELHANPYGYTDKSQCESLYGECIQRGSVSV